MNILLRVLFMLLLIALIAFFSYEAYFSNSSGGISSIVIQACFFVPPLLAALVLTPKLEVSNIPWSHTFFLSLFGWFQHETHSGFAILLPFFINVWLSYAIGIKCFSKRRLGGATRYPTITKPNL